MSTATLPTPARRVATIAEEIVLPLQRAYLRDEPHAVAALARLRRGAGREFPQVPDLWGLVDTGPLHEVPKDGGGLALSEAELARAEDALHVALTLWALHQQSRQKGMHAPNRPKAPTGLGAAVRQLMPKDEIAEPVRKRLVRAGNAPNLTALAERLRDIVLLLRREDIALDYVLLAEQLYRWQTTGGRDSVRRAWGSSFNAHRADAGEDTDDGDPTTASEATTDKDLS